MPISAIETFQSLGLKTSADVVEKKTQELGQEQFLTLLTTQLTHQDPTKPMEDGDFLAQMAQFSTVEGIGDLNDSFNEFASSLSSGQALQAASLVGQSVLVPNNKAFLSLGKDMTGEVVLSDKSSDLSVKITNSTGQVVKTLQLGSQEEGNVAFKWDGVKDDGTFADPGVYSISAEAHINDNNTVLETYVNAEVESVGLGSKEGIQLALIGLDEVNFNQVKKIF